MRVRTAIIAGHCATLIVAYGLFESASYFSSIGGIDIRTIVFFSSIIAAITGLTLLAWKSANKERITFAISTVFSFFLLIWAFSTSVISG